MTLVRNSISLPFKALFTHDPIYTHFEIAINTPSEVHKSISWFVITHGILYYIEPPSFSKSKSAAFPYSGRTVVSFQIALGYSLTAEFEGGEIVHYFLPLS